jgi:predicted glycogen debranching enzyme
MITLPSAAVNDLGAPVQREWLITNGIGGYAMGAVNGTRTRRYHGLLIAALQPPVGRWLMAAAIDDLLFAGSPHVSFALEGSTPVWTLDTDEIRLSKRIFMAHEQNTTYVRYTLERAAAPLTLTGSVRAVYRDHHTALIHASDSSAPASQSIENGLRIRLTPDAAPLTLAASNADWMPSFSWHTGEMLAVEAERGFDHVEDTLTVAVFRAKLNAGDTITVVLSAEETPELDAEAAYRAHVERDAALEAQAGFADVPAEIRLLVHAADQFVVRRPMAGGAHGDSVIAGYPWFGDWGRDTMIALPGLTLATGRHDIARGILTTFARYVDHGMLPNRFPDSGEAPEYNTVDATLWYFEAIRAYHAASGDLETVRALYPVLQDIVAHHIAGTRFSIKVDPADGLLRAGSGADNLTWMDAKIDGVPMTPRHGKPVEICALWINALAVMRDFAALLGQSGDEYAAMYEKAAASFSKFWDAKRGYLLDVIDPDDATLRPNQLIAAMLPSVPLTPEQLRGIVDTCREKLYTPYGMRTLPPEHPDYHGVFTGDWRTRDAMYHQGPAWSWLLGPFISAHLRAHNNRTAARALLDAALTQLYDGCVGSVSELFDGDSPHHSRAASAQAWGVAELLRVWSQLSR